MHEHLYRVGAALQVDLAEYLRNLMEDQGSLVSTLEGRTIKFDAASASWSSSDAPSVGLVVMELVTNALKYGEGVIAVTLRRTGDEVVLTVEDEGQALPSDFAPSDSKGLGMRVLTGLLAGQRGRLEIDRSRGHTCFVATMRARVPS